MKRLSIIIAMIVALWANATNAGHKGDTLETYNMFWSQLPVICGNTMDVAVYLEEHDFKLESVSTGRAGASGLFFVRLHVGVVSYALMWLSSILGNQTGVSE